MIVSTSFNSIEVFGLTALALAGVISYYFVFRERLKKNEAVFASVVFGLASNPVWLAVAFSIGLLFGAK